jgi:hypothetical protein
MGTSVEDASVIWDITLCSPMEVKSRFGGRYYPHLRNRKLNEARNQHEASSKILHVHSSENW